MGDLDPCCILDKEFELELGTSLERMFGSCRCLGRWDETGESGGVFSGEEAIGLRGLAGRKSSRRLERFGVKFGSGWSGATVEELFPVKVPDDAEVVVVVCEINDMGGVGEEDLKS